MSLLIAPAKATLRIVVLSPHRLVPLALRAAGRCEGAYELAGAASDAEETLSLVEAHQPDVLVMDPTALSLGKAFHLIEMAGLHLRHPKSVTLLLEPAQPATSIAARFMWEAGVRSAMTSQESPDVWPVAIMSAARGATFVSPVASELFGLPRGQSSGIWDGLAKGCAFTPMGAW